MQQQPPSSWNTNGGGNSDADDLSARFENAMNDLMKRITTSISEAARLSTLREIRKIAERGVTETPVRTETMMEVMTALVTLVSVSTSYEQMHESTATLSALGALFEHVNTVGSTAAPGPGYQQPMPPTKTDIPDMIRRQLDDLL